MTIYDLKLKTITGELISMSEFKGKILLIVNTASKSAYTHQYESLQRVYEHFYDDGFVVLGFPCNQFGGQEPGTNEEILSFVKTRFGISFPMFEKTDVNGEEEHPLYSLLKEEFPGDIEWNFEKFLVDREGHVVERFDKTVEPRQIVDDIDEIV